MRTILLATDGSECGDKATAMAASLANAWGAGIVAVTVTAEVPAGDVLSRVEGGTGEATELVGGVILQQAVRRCREMGVPSVKTEQTVGDPAEMILEAAGRLKPDLIVVGRRGRGRLTGLLLGSVSQKLASLSPCAVLIVP